ncbi:MAG: type II toxin-antitoxin system HicB family antitoxin [Chloroflexota bacterium]
MLTYDPEWQGYVVTVPALPGCMTQGKTVQEALTMAKDAISLWVAVLEERGEPVPAEGDLPPVVTTVGVATAGLLNACPPPRT